MLEHITTPFGRRSLTAAQITAQANAAVCPAETTVDKWAVLRHIAIARSELGLSDRALAVLSALLSFHPETALCARTQNDLVVFPSNAKLAQRAHGIGEKTLRRHLAALVEAGLIIRRDSPNGKRYTRKGEGGKIVQAFGFDLTPFVARASEFSAAATRIEAEQRMERIMRERLSLARRDLIKLVTYAQENGLVGPWDAFLARSAEATASLNRRADRTAVEVAGTVLIGLVAEASKLLAEPPESTIQTGNAGQNDRHHHNSKPDALESENGTRQPEEEPVVLKPGEGGAVYPLSMVLGTCPDIADYARGDIRSWRDLLETAGLVRSILGISPSSWLEAQEVLGPEAAAVLIAAILQRAEHIRSPGGYLRALVARKRAGQFSLRPVLNALQRRQEIERAQLQRSRPLPPLSSATTRMIRRSGAD